MVGRHVALDVEANERPSGASAVLFLKKRAATGEMTLPPVDHPVEAKFTRRPRTIFSKCLVCGDKVHIRHNKAGLDTRKIERLCADGTNTPRGARCEQM